LCGAFRDRQAFDQACLRFGKAEKLKTGFFKESETVLDSFSAKDTQKVKAKGFLSNIR
jgi:hypothetical protein